VSGIGAGAASHGRGSPAARAISGLIDVIILATLEPSSP
jgi:hypothetical protein